MWFSKHNPMEVWGDDWNDISYEHNAGIPYSDYGPFKKLIYHDTSGNVITPDYNCGNSPYSVEGINKKKIPWLRNSPYTDTIINIFAGEAYENCIDILSLAGVEIFIKYDIKAENKVLDLLSTCRKRMEDVVNGLEPRPHLEALINKIKRDYKV